MALSFTPVTADSSLSALAASIAAIKGDTPLRPVSVIVSTNATGVTARRYLGRTTGIAAVDMLTLSRLAEVIAGPLLAQDRRPVSAPVLELTIRAVLTSPVLSSPDLSSPGTAADLDATEASAIATGVDAGQQLGNLFAPVARHASTITALRELYQETRDAGPGAFETLGAGSVAARAAVEVLTLVRDRLATEWYDQADLFMTAVAQLRAGTPPPSANDVIVLCPDPPLGVELELLAALAASATVEVLCTWTGHDHLDREFEPLIALSDDTASPTLGDGAPRRVSTQAAPPTVVSVTDADEEVRTVTRQVLDVARSGVAFDRIAILWPQTEPYARLVEHHLTRAEIVWNGRPGTQIGERVVPRFLLDLLELDRRRLRRSAVFELLSDINVRDRDGNNAPTARWERVARAAGIADDSDWGAKLRRYAERQRRQAAAHGSDTSWRADDAEALLAFVEQLRRDLGDRRATRSWGEWASWARDQIGTRLGTDLLTGRAEAERLASDHTQRVLDRLGHLDALGGGPVTRAEFRAVFAAEFDNAPGRIGRIGNGVTVGSIAGHHALDLDHVFVLGAAEGVMPPAPRADPLISETDRSNAGLPPTERAARRIERQFIGVLAAVPNVTVLFPRGDLRGSLERFPSRWIPPTAPLIEVPSHHAALLQTGFPVNGNEYRLRHYLAATSGRLLDVSMVNDDPSLESALTMRAARRSELVTAYDGDLSSVPRIRLSAPVSPTQIQAWPTCPNAYFQHYLLGVHEVDDPGLELSITPMERGNVLHQTLDRLHREVIAGTLAQPTNGWTKVHVDRGVELFNTVADEFEASGRTGRPAAWNVERRGLLTELYGWFEADSARLAQHPATIVSSEAAFGAAGDTTVRLDDGRELLVKGSIDRIDQLGDGQLKVIDHKTGKADDYRTLSADNPTHGGAVFQLPVYAAGARTLMNQPDAPVTAAYSMMAREKFREYGYRFSPAVDARVSAALTRVVGGIESGFYPANPDAPGFVVYVKCRYCDPDGLGTAALFETTRAKWADPRFERWMTAGSAERAEAGAEASS